MNKKLITLTIALVAMMATVGLQGCATMDETGYIAGNAIAGAAAGALTGAAISPKGDGRRSDAAVRGALGGLVLGSTKGYLDVERNRRDRRSAEAAAAGTTHQDYREVIVVNKDGRVIEHTRRQSTTGSRTYRGYPGAPPVGI